MFSWNYIKKITIRVLAGYGLIDVAWVAKHQIMQQQIEHIPYFVTIGILILGIAGHLVVKNMLDELDIEV